MKALLALRDYQREAIEAVRREVAAGHRRTLVVAPTGSGKTWLIAELAGRAALRQRRTLIVAHREEILDQLAERVRPFAPGFAVIDQAERRADPLSPIIVGSIATLGSRSPRRLERLGRFGVLCCDEAHHAPAEIYQRVFRRVGVWEDAAPVLVGFTATPLRGDGIGLGHIFESIAYEISVQRLIAAEVLAEIRAFTIRTDVVLDHVRRRGEDYDEEDLARSVNTAGRNAIAVRAFQTHAAGLPTLAFCANLQHVADLTATFVAAGVRAVAVTGDLSREVRQARLEAFRQRTVDVLVSCMILGEGIDLPQCRALLLARPTRSVSLLQQQVGRGLRIAEGLDACGAGPALPPKRHVIVLDVVDVTADKSLCTVATLAGLPPRIRFSGELVFQVRERVSQALATSPWLAAAIELGKVVTPEDIVAATQARDLLYVELPVPDEVRSSRYEWIAVPPDRFVLPTPAGTCVIRQTLLAYEVGWRAPHQAPEALGQTENLDEALGLAATAVRTRVEARALRMLGRAASWRQRPASERQRALLDRLGIPFDQRTTAGDANRALSRRLSGMKGTRGHPGVQWAASG